MKINQDKSSPVLLVDSEQRDRAARCLDRCLCVEAGAGTGKTTLLVDRVVNILRSDPETGIENLVVITFTEKASAELKLRIRDKLEQLSAENEALLKAFRNLDKARISTIHSFAADILRERPVEARIDPDFSIMDQMENQLLFDELWEQWLALRMESGADGIRRALLMGVTPEQMQKTAASLYANRELLPLSDAETSRGPDYKEFIDGLKNYVESLQEIQSACVDPSDNGYKQIKRLRLDLEKIMSLDEEGSLGFILDRMTVPTGKGNKKNWRSGEECAKQKDLCAQLKEHLERFRENISCAAAVELFRELSGFVDYIQQEKHKRGLLDFHDLLIITRDLLKHDLDVRRYFQERFRYILVDEFQDTDPLQAEIIFFISEDGPEASRWEDTRPIPGKLFLVGDPKQSIYRFRRADLEVYARARKIIEQQGEIISIVQNFRSVPGVIDWVNEAFRPLIKPPDDGNYQPNYEDLYSFRTDDAGQGTVQRLGLEIDAGESDINTKRRIEAECIADAISSRDWMVWETNTGRWRPALFGDIAVLFPSSSGIEYYENALKAREIPYSLEAGRRFYSRDETVDLSVVLSAVDNPRDALSLVAALRSAYFGVSDEEIFIYRAGGGILDYQRGSPEPGSDMERAFEILREIHSVRNTLPTAGVLGLLLEHTRALERLSLEYGGRQAVSNLYKLREQARAFETAGFSFHRFVHWLNRMRREEYLEEDFPSLGEGNNAVSLLTIHKAKGLEFPVVILANLMSSPNHRSDCIANCAEGKLDLSLGSKTKGFCTPDYSRASEWNKAREKAEDLRLLYVAATRAKDRLVIPDLQGNTKSYGEHFRSALDSIRPTVVKPSPGTRRRDSKQKTDAVEESGNTALERYRSWLEKRENLLARTPKAIKLLTPSGEELLGNQSDDLSIRADSDALDLGSAFHAVMEKLELPGGSDLESKIRQAAEEYGIINRKDLLLKMTLNWLQSPVMDRVRSAVSLYREVPVSAYIEGKIVEGSVDLIIEEKDGLVVVDYKTDDVDENSLEERAEVYRPQLLLYVESLEKACGIPVKEAVIFFARTGKARSMFIRSA